MRVLTSSARPAAVARRGDGDGRLPGGGMDWLGITHLGAALGSLATGFGVVVTAKGTTLHRRLGWSYVACMVVVNGTALMIYDLFGRFGPFHVAALVSGGGLLMGVLASLRRKPRKLWIAYHAYWMTWSYVGLAAAAVSEVSTRYLAMPFGWTVAVATGVVVAIGAALIRWRMPTILRGMGIGASKKGPTVEMQPG